MNRYFLFAGEVFYAKGGIHDLRGLFDSFDIALEKAQKMQHDDECQWWHIWDAYSGQIVDHFQEAYS